MSIFWPNVDEEAGRRSAVRRGFWGGVVITMITALGPPPMGAISLVVFGLITLGIHLQQPWAPRAGALAAYAPLLLAAQQPDRTLLFGAFFQCTILAYFFFSAWRGLRAKGGLLHQAAGAFWLALSLAFVWAWYLSSGVQRVPYSLNENLPLTGGDTVLVRPVTAQPKLGDIVLVRSEQGKAPPHFEWVTGGTELDPKEVLGVATWLLWSDEADSIDAPIAYYTKARWGRFPRQLR